MHLGPTDLVVLGAHAKKKELIGRLRAVSAELAVPASQRASHLVVTRHVPTTCILVASGVTCVSVSHSIVRTLAVRVCCHHQAGIPCVREGWVIERICVDPDVSRNRGRCTYNDYDIEAGDSSREPPPKAA